MENRPINLDLRYLKFPPMAIASILHRISGLVLFVLLPMMLYFLNFLHSPADFVLLTQLLQKPVLKVLVWLFGTALIYHSLAGVRHILMDLGFGERVQVGRVSALFVLGLALILSLMLWGWIW